MVNAMAGTAAKASGFELAPPRRFILPALLLLLSEQPGYGYGLVPRLREFRFGHVDRPAAYRALAQLERDDLIESSSQDPKVAQNRRMYRITALGERVLRIWMAVVKEEHDNLGEVLRRYQATGRLDAMLAEVEGGWASPLRAGWSAVSPTSLNEARPAPSGGEQAPPTVTASTAPLDRSATAFAVTPEQRTFHLIPDRSVVLIEARSTVGPLRFGAIGLSGSVQAALESGTLCTEAPASGRLQLDLSGFRSGNSWYDAELLRRIDARRFPNATVELHELASSGCDHRYLLQGAITYHGVTRPASGAVSVEALSESRLVISGEQVFDIRDFAIESPTVLMFRIYPDVRVRLHAEATIEEA